MRCARGGACLNAELVDGLELGGLIHPGEAWDLGHADGESVGGPEHLKCDRRAWRETRNREARTQAVEGLVSGWLAWASVLTREGRVR